MGLLTAGQPAPSELIAGASARPTISDPTPSRKASPRETGAGAASVDTAPPRLP